MPADVSTGQLTSQSLFGITPPDTRQTAGMFPGGYAMPADPSQDSPQQAANRVQALGPLTALLHPQHSTLFWMLAALATLIVLNGRARTRGRRKKK